MTSDNCRKCGKTADEVTLVQFAGLCESCATQLGEKQFSIDGLTLWFVERTARTALAKSTEIIEKEAAGNLIAFISNLKPFAGDNVVVVPAPAPAEPEPVLEKLVTKKKKTHKSKKQNVTPNDATETDSGTDFEVRTTEEV